MTDQEKLSIRCGLLELIAKAQSLLLVVGDAAESKPEPKAIGRLRRESLSALIRKWLTEHSGEEFVVAQVADGIGCHRMDFNNRTGQFISKGYMEIINKGCYGKDSTGKTNPSVYRSLLGKDGKVMTKSSSD